MGMQSKCEKRDAIVARGLRDEQSGGVAQFWCATSKLPARFRRKTDAHYRIGILVSPGFALEEYALFVGALESVEAMEGGVSFQIKTFSERGGEVESTLKSRVETHSLDGDDLDFDFFFVISDFGSRFHNALRLRVVLARLQRQGCTIGAIGGAVVALVALGLSDEKSLAVHWRQRELVSESAPCQQTSSKFCETDGRLWTSCGRTSALDMAINLTAKVGGASLGVLLAKEFVHSRTFDHQARWDEEILTLPVTGSPMVNKALGVFEKNLERPLKVREVARRIGVSQRQLERQFAVFCGTSPAQRYREIRISHARNLVLRTDLSLTEISVIVGFSSVSSLAASYRKTYGSTPTLDRKQFRFEQA